MSATPDVETVRCPPRHRPATRMIQDMAGPAGAPVRLAAQRGQHRPVRVRRRACQLGGSGGARELGAPRRRRPGAGRSPLPSCRRSGHRGGQRQGRPAACWRGSRCSSTSYRPRRQSPHSRKGALFFTPVRPSNGNACAGPCAAPSAAPSSSRAGLATSQGAETLAANGGVRFRPNHDFDAVGPMTGLTTRSMPVMVVENRRFGNRATARSTRGWARSCASAATTPRCWGAWGGCAIHWDRCSARRCGRGTACR